MGDPWTEFYRSVGIGAPYEAPVPQTPMSVEEIYRGIIPSAPAGLTSRPVSTVPINPATGMPFAQSAPTSGGGTTYFPPGGNYGYNGISGDYEVKQPGQPYVSMPAPKFSQTARPTTAPIAPSTGRAALPLGMQLNNGSRDSVTNRTAGRLAGTGLGLPASVETPQRVAFEPMSDTSGQNMADSMGRTIVTPSGKTYTPRQGNGAARTMPQVSPSTMRAPQQRQGGLLNMIFGNGGIFGGNNQNAGSPPSSGSPAIGNSPSQGGAMVVSPGTSTGSTLSSMGFSDGALIPAATIRNLSERKYI